MSDPDECDFCGRIVRTPNTMTPIKNPHTGEMHQVHVGCYGGAWAFFERRYLSCKDETHDIPHWVCAVCGVGPSRLRKLVHKIPEGYTPGKYDWVHQECVHLYHGWAAQRYRDEAAAADNNNN